MPRFIKLTNMLLNTNHINKILIKPNKYYIQIISRKPDRFINIIFNNNEIEVCQTKHPTDYKIVSEWINIGRFE